MEKINEKNTFETKPENMGGHCCTIIQLVDFLLPHLSFCRI